MARVHANGLSFHVNRFRTGPPGDRPVVVCIHGLGIVDSASVSFVVGFDLGQHADVICYDLRGHGRSDRPPSGYRIIDHAADLVALLDALGITQPVHLIAFSYGGAIATAATVLYRDRVASLALLDGAVPLPGWEKALNETVERDQRIVEDAKSRGLSLDEIIEQEIVPWIVAETGASRRRATRTAERMFRMFEDTSLHDDIRNEVVFAEHDIRRIQCPVLGVYGDKSELFHLADLLPHLVTDVRIHKMADADHLSVYWRLDEIRPLVREFLGLPTSAGAKGEHQRARPGYLKPWRAMNCLTRWGRSR